MSSIQQDIGILATALFIPDTSTSHYKTSLARQLAKMPVETDAEYEARFRRFIANAKSQQVRSYGYSSSPPYAGTTAAASSWSLSTLLIQYKPYIFLGLVIYFLIYLVVTLNCWFWPYTWPLKVYAHEKVWWDQFNINICKFFWSTICDIVLPFYRLLRWAVTLIRHRIDVIWQSLKPAITTQSQRVGDRLHEHNDHVQRQWALFTTHPMWVEMKLKWMAFTTFLDEWWFTSIVTVILVTWALSFMGELVWPTTRSNGQYVLFNSELDNNYVAGTLPTIRYEDFLTRTAPRPSKEFPPIDSATELSASTATSWAIETNTVTETSTATITSWDTTTATETSTTTVTVWSKTTMTEVRWKNVKLDQSPETVTEWEIVTPGGPIVKAYKKKPGNSNTATITKTVREPGIVTTQTEIVKDHVTSFSTETATTTEYQPTTITETILSTQDASTTTSISYSTIVITETAEASSANPSYLTITKYPTAQSYYVPGSIDDQVLKEITKEELEELRGPLVLREVGYAKKESILDKDGFQYCDLCKQHHGHEIISISKAYVYEKEEPAHRRWQAKASKPNPIEYWVE